MPEPETRTSSRGYDASLGGPSDPEMALGSPLPGRVVWTLVPQFGSYIALLRRGLSARYRDGAV